MFLGHYYGQADRISRTTHVTPSTRISQKAFLPLSKRLSLNCTTQPLYSEGSLVIQSILSVRKAASAFGKLSTPKEWITRLSITFCIWLTTVKRWCIPWKHIESLLYRLCGLVVRVSGCRYRGPGFDSRRYQIFWVVVGLERGPLSLVRSTEELLE